jgi:hypothetical protein
MLFEHEFVDHWEYCRSWTQSYATGSSLRDLKKKCLILTPMHKTHPPLQLIILKHKTVFYTYQKTVYSVV